MAKRDSNLLHQIEDDVVNGRPVADTLRKAVILGGRTGSPALREWASRELKGYAKADQMPDYRIVTAPLCIDAVVGHMHVTGRQISSYDLPDFAQNAITNHVRLNMGIGEIEAIFSHRPNNHEAVHLSPPGAPELVTYINGTSNQPYQHVTAIYWSVSLAVLRGVTDHVATTLTELISEMRAGTPEDQDLPTADVATQAVTVAVHGTKARVVVSTAQAIGPASARVSPLNDAEPAFWRSTRFFWSAAVGVATIAATVIAWIGN